MNDYMTTDLDLETAGTAHFECHCCGLDSETVHGFIYGKDGSTTVYFAGYTPLHANKSLNIAFSIGGWGEGTTHEDRKSVAILVTIKGINHSVTFPDIETSPWFGEAFLGEMLNPDDLSDEDRAFCRNLTDTVLTKDARVIDYIKAQ